MEAALRPEPTVFRIRRGRINEVDLLERLARQGFRVLPVEGLSGLFRVEAAPYPVSMTLEHWQGFIYVQQASTAVAAPALGAQPGERILDLCSAPGGKTTHLADLMQGTGCLVANEIDERRIRGLLGNVYRLGHTNILVTAGDGRRFPEGPLFDRVLVDAPCSGEGTLRRRSGKPPNQSRSFLGYVTSAQRALLQKAIRLTRPGGTVLYVTCTFAPEENEAIVTSVLRDCTVEIEPLQLDVPSAPGLTSFEGHEFDPRLTLAARIYPHHLDSGGLFMARLRRLPADASSEGWSPVPLAFPGEAEAVQVDGERIASAVSELHDRYGIDTSAHPEWRWMVRGGRAWLHSAAEWPVAGWRGEGWRVVSLGLRALEFDSRGRLRPTNDFLRLAGRDVHRSVVDLSQGDMGRMLAGYAVPADTEVRGPVVLRWGCDIIGRGATAPDGVVSEVPKARAADLERVLEARSSPAEV